MDRRNFLRVGALAVANAALPHDLEAADIPQTANTLAKQFPDAKTLPEVARIDHHIVENAKRLLVVFRQLHLSPVPKDAPAGFTHPEPEIWHVEQSQLELYKIMDHLLDRPTKRFNHVMCEEIPTGLKPDSLDEWRNEYQDRMRQLLPRKRRGTAGGMINPGLLGNLAPLETRLDKRVRGISTLGYVGAGKLMGFTRGIEILPACDPALEKEVDTHIANQDPRAYDHWVFTKREEAVFRLAAESKRLVSFVIYGCNHKWPISMQKWNREHPQERFSVLQITSKIIQKHDDFLEESRK